MKKDVEPEIDFYPTVDDGAQSREVIESLRNNQINPKLLYVSPRQAELWRQVFLKHSPMHANPAFVRIYEEAFARVIERSPPGRGHLVGLGCGTGAKEQKLYATLKSSSREALFSAIDVSRDLVLESAQKLIKAGAEHRRSLVCDLVETGFLKEWLNGFESDLPRWITFFGLVPNLAPSVVGRIFRAVLRPGDVLLVSAHLAPVTSDDREEMPAAMQTLLPQYDNPETLAWLAAALERWGLEKRLGPLEMIIGEEEGIPAFLGLSAWKPGDAFEKWGDSFLPNVTEPLRLFCSLRYTPALFEETLRSEGFYGELLAMTPCRQEGIWRVTTI